MAMREEKADLRQKVYILEKEKSSLERHIANCKVTNNILFLYSCIFFLQYIVMYIMRLLGAVMLE